MKKVLLISLLLIIFIPMVYSESCKSGEFWNEQEGSCERARIITTTTTNQNYFIKFIFFLAGFGLGTILYSKLKLHEEIKNILKKRTK